MNTLPLESNGNISLKKLLTAEEFKTFEEIPPDLVEKFNALRDSIRAKLAKLGRKNKNLQFLTKTVYERDGQTTEIQGMIHSGPKEMYEKIEKQKQKTDISVYEGSPDNRSINQNRQKTKAGYESQLEHLSIRPQDTRADISEKEINLEIEKQLTESEIKIFRAQNSLIKQTNIRFPHTQNHETRKMVIESQRPENINLTFFGQEDLGADSPFSSEKIQETSQMEGSELREATEEIIDELNMLVIEINQTKKKSYKEQLIREFFAVQATYIAPLKYIWHTEGDTKKTDWLNNQIQKFDDPELNINNIHWEQVILEKRNNIAVSTISRVEEKHKTIHATYGEAHLPGMHDRMLQEGWTLKDIELMPVEYPKVPWWKRIGETIKKPFWKFKTRKERRELKRLIKQAKKENIEQSKKSDTQIEMIDEKGRSKLVPFYEVEDAPTSKDPNSSPEPEKTKEPKDESLDTAA